MNFIKKILLITLCISIFYTSEAQTKRIFGTNNNGWIMYFGDHKISDKWGVHLEAQVRRSDIIKSQQQLLLRTGVNYHFNPQAFATLGYAFVETYPYGAQPAKSAFPENRFWEQIQVKNQVGFVELINRFRLEQRYVNAPVPTAIGSTIFEPGDAVYTNRFRMLNRISIPFKGKKIEDKSLYISTYYELFVNFGKKVTFNIFDQNRAYIALGYKISKVGKLEIGYLNQLIFKGDGIKVENNHTLQVGLSSTVDFYKKKS